MTHRVRSRIVVAMALVAAVAAAPWAAPHDPIAQDLLAALAGPSLAHPIGTDALGRDVASRLLAGAPASLGLAGAAVALSAVLGTALGMIAAAGGAWLRAAILRVADMMLAFPGLLLALLLSGLFGGGVWPVMIGLQVTQWPQFARLAEAVATGELMETHVEAARLAGFSRRWVLAVHVLPPVMRQVLPLAVLGFGSGVATVSALGFLGLGLQPPAPEWGSMIAEGVPHLHEAVLPALAPAAAVFLSILAAARLSHAFGEASPGTTVSEVTP